MEIFGSNQYVDQSKHKEWLQLSVINMWDLVTNPICFRMAGHTLIAYCLEHHVSNGKNGSMFTKIETLNEEMKQQLLKDGYSLK